MAVVSGFTAFAVGDILCGQTSFVLVQFAPGKMHSGILEMVRRDDSTLGRDGGECNIYR